MIQTSDQYQVFAGCVDTVVSFAYSFSVCLVVHRHSQWRSLPTATLRSSLKISPV
ncbi:hypothetical protein BD309DRAFT_144414 [Dichomitus squalens]|uniref:Uncharacterized protein n=1 Tax=Dichomitus squalens TaxID=114155 RepID=A0A4Q9PYE8_9APHY|nr:hypothetical protein BD311DRAFT_819097 [Dichomitus squalens]TBU42976.1 hypothetical protein BD309DRAFT_144414 [Dichomitus squalens]TBU59807.1 hypothetical protein BD310DRAFT_373475 [Dichomitus squalens]